MGSKHVVWAILWSGICFFISILQNVYGQYIVITEGRLDISGIVKSKGFWGILIIWLVGCMVDLKFKSNSEQKDTKLEQINYGNNNVQIGVQNNYGGNDSKEYARGGRGSDCKSE